MVPSDLQYSAHNIGFYSAARLALIVLSHEIRARNGGARRGETRVSMATHELRDERYVAITFSNFLKLFIGRGFNFNRIGKCQKNSKKMMELIVLNQKDPPCFDRLIFLIVITCRKTHVGTINLNFEINYPSLDIRVEITSYYELNGVTRDTK